MRPRIPPRSTLPGNGSQAEQHRQRGAQQQVIEFATAVLLDPFPLVLVDYVAPMEHARRA
jgi:hypothetical protein